MEFKGKVQQRAFLEGKMVTVPIVSTRRGMTPASADEYACALRGIESRISETQRQMLIGHAMASGQVLTMTQLAVLAGHNSFQIANSQYGSLGRKLVASLGVLRPKRFVYAIASFDDDPESGESRAHMYPELRQALLQLDWLPVENGAQASAELITSQYSKEQQLVSSIGDSMLSTQDIITALEQVGFTRPVQSGLKVVRLEHQALPVPLYLKQGSSVQARLPAPLVLHPQYEEQLSGWLSIAGIERGQTRYYHNSNLRGFPKRRNGGAAEINYGIDLGIHHLEALETLIGQLLGKPPKTETPQVELAQVFAEDHLGDVALTDTERESLIKARIGQNGYREALLAYWGGCAVTDCSVPALLRASHIKPWRAASASERLDPFNGLLLTPNLDLAFDQGLISFDDQGRILLGSDLDPDSAAALNLTPELRLRQIESRHRDYLAWHREHLFRD